MVKTFTDSEKQQFINAIGGMLAVQEYLSHSSIDDDQGRPKRKALGYVFGYVDAALHSLGYDIADVTIGIPILFQIMRKLWPDRVEDYMDALVANINIDPLITLGMTHGGQQYLDYSKENAKGMAMGLARFMSETSSPILK